LDPDLRGPVCYCYITAHRNISQHYAPHDELLLWRESSAARRLALGDVGPLAFGEVYLFHGWPPLGILNHLRAKLFRDLLSRDGPSPLRADLGALISTRRNVEGFTDFSLVIGMV
jgi:hypothetical protein